MFWSVFEVSLFVLLLIAGVLIAIWENAKAGGLFKFVGLNQIMTFDGGEDTPVRVAANLPDGWKIEGLRILRDQQFRPFRGLMRKFGIFWKGFPAKLHVWSFVHERLNPKRDDSTLVMDWVLRDKEPKSSDYLLFEKPHWVAVPGVEFRNGFRAHLLVSYWSRTIDLEKAYNLRGDIFPPMNSAVLAHTKTECSKYSYDDFTKIDTDGTITSRDEVVNLGDDFCLNIAEGATTVSVREAGQVIYDVSVLFFDAADRDAERLLSAKAKAEIELEVAKLRARGSVADITELAGVLKNMYPGAPEADILSLLRELGVAERVKDSNLVAWNAPAMVGVKGGGNATQMGGKKGKR